MEHYKIGVDVPIWVWLSDLLIALSYAASFGSLMTSIWMMALGLHIHWGAPLVFGIFSALLLVMSRPYVNTKQTMQELVQNDKEAGDDGSES